ncbi:hypothetical protein JW948_04555 [bacterium]|nr:hypothetical protein [bacterium]
MTAPNLKRRSGEAVHRAIFRVFIWIFLPILFRGPGCQAEVSGSRARSMACLKVHVSPPGDFNRSVSVLLRGRQETIQGGYAEYGQNHLGEEERSVFVLRMGMMINFISLRNWHWDADGGVRIMNGQAGYEMGLVSDNFSFMPLGLHTHFYRGKLEGRTFTDVAASAGILFLFMQWEAGYRNITGTAHGFQGPYVGCCVWM